MKRKKRKRNVIFTFHISEEQGYVQALFLRLEIIYTYTHRLLLELILYTEYSMERAKDSYWTRFRRSGSRRW